MSTLDDANEAYANSDGGSQASYGGGGSGYGGAVSDFGSAAADLLSIPGLRGTESLDKAAAASYQQDIGITKSITAIKQQQLQRQSFLTGSQIQANAGANGVRMAGSAANILRAAAGQGALAVANAGEEGQLKENSYAMAASAELEKAKAAGAAITGAYVGAAFSTVAGVASIAGG